MITRKIGKILRGQATPFQIMMACVLGSLIGFTPGFMNGPGYMISLILLLIILNANLGLALLMGTMAKAISFPLLPVSFAAGRVLLDGPTQGLFKVMVNAPVLALFGLDHYAVTGGALIGLVFGITTGLIITSFVRRFRTLMSGLEESSALYQKLSNARWAKMLAWLLIGGGKGKLTYSDLLTRRIGNPVRIPGVIFAVLVIALLFVVSLFASGPIVTMALKRGLEETNGATVDFETVDLDLTKGKLVVTGFAAADPNALDTDLFRAARIEADVSGTDLLRKRLTIDRIVITDASTGAKRAIPGRRTSTAPLPDEAKGEHFVLLPGEKTIDEYIVSAKKWKERLAQVRRWLEKVSNDQSGAAGPEDSESRDARIAREIRELGYARVTASHLIEDSPTLFIRELIAQGVTVTQIEGETLDILAANLSSHPHLSKTSPSFSVTSRSGNILVESKPASDQPGAASVIALMYRNLAIDSIARDFVIGGEQLMRGGTMDIAMNGTWSEFGVGYLDLPLQITLHNSTITLPGAGSSEIERLMIPIALRGPLDNPRITVDPNLLADALLAAGAGELAGRIRGETDELIDRAAGKLGDKLGEQAENILGGTLTDLLKGGKKKKDGNQP